MKPNAFVLLLSVTTAHPQGTLERYGAGGSIIERFRSDNGRRQIPIVNGHPVHRTRASHGGARAARLIVAAAVQRRRAQVGHVSRLKAQPEKRGLKNAFS